jgi:hypothetical protein
MLDANIGGPCTIIDIERVAKLTVLQDGAIVVTIPSSRFRAVYYKPHGQPQLILRERSKTDDYEVLARAWKLANDEGRELGWFLTQSGH